MASVDIRQPTSSGSSVAARTMARLSRTASGALARDPRRQRRAVLERLALPHSTFTRPKW